MKTLYAVLIGINNYPSNKLYGCTNDALAINDFFQKLCQSQTPAIRWHPHFLLAPHEEEKQHVVDKGITYQNPSRQNIITAFDHFNQADPQGGDYCLFYYSGHGSYVGKYKIDLFKEYEPDYDELQSLVCLDSDSASENTHHLLDKELGYLIAKTLEGKGETKDQAGLHFLSLMDCCHSGTNTRAKEMQIKARRHTGATTQIPEEILGFTTTENCFYKAFSPNQSRVQTNGITAARHINFSAAQSSESAYEMSLSLSTTSENAGSLQHGIFTVSLIKTLNQCGTHISYRELAQRIQMAVRSQIVKQIPHLDLMLSTDADLYFLRNELSPPKREYPIAFREKPNGEWILKAGSIQGIVPSSVESITTIQLQDGTKRIVEIRQVGPSESVLNNNKFTETDKTNNLLSGSIQEMAYPTVPIAFSKSLSSLMRDKLNTAWKTKPPHHLRFVDNKQTHDLEINQTIDQSGLVQFVLNHPKSSVPFSQSTPVAEVLLQDAEKIARFEIVTQLNNPNSTISRDLFQVEIKALEGVPFNASNLNDIPDEQYRLVDLNDPSVHYKKIDNEFIQPAIKVKVTCTKPHDKVYWIGALFCNAQYGITDQYLDVQRIGKNHTDTVHLAFKINENGVVKKWSAIPLEIDSGLQKLGVKEIRDQVIFFISEGEVPFELSGYNQEEIAFETTRGAAFVGSRVKLKEASWCTIKVPIDVFLY